MIRKITASLLFAALVTSALHAAPDLGTISNEVTAQSVTIPVDNRGTISVKNCDSCKERVLGLLPNTIYQIGETPVRRETMRAELLKRPTQVMLVELTPDRKNVARLKITPAAQ